MLLSAALWQSGAVFAFGGPLYLARAGPVPASLSHWRARVRLVLALSCGLAWCAGFWVLTQTATRIAGHPLGIGAPEWMTLLSDTRIGQVWLIKQLLMTVLGIVAGIAVWRRTEATRALIALSGLFLSVGIWAGHGGTTSPLMLNLPLHGLHALAAAGWLGGLPLWVWLVAQTDLKDTSRDYLGRAIRRFSTFALIMIGVLVTSGSLIAYQQFGRWPAYFGTLAGATLTFKLSLLGVALVMAWQLRQRFVQRLCAPHDRTTRRAALQLVLVELAAALGVFALALALAQMPPAAHQPISWWLPFRLAPAAGWADPGARWFIIIGLTLALCSIPAVTAGRRRLAAGFLMAGLVIIGYGCSVPAFPDTYRRPTVAYSARSIAAGADLFAVHCVACHGPGARGDERPAVGGRPLAPDLSEHTALHTAGDMYWWITHGTPSGAMPGFSHALSAAQRWHLINFLRAFATGHRARVLGPELISAKARIDAPNFAYETGMGEHVELKAFRDRRPVWLILASARHAATRIAELTAAGPALRAAGVVPMLGLVDGKCREVVSALDAIPCLALTRESLAYRLLARTLKDPGSRHQLAPEISHAEFLIDRAGYLRARWIPALDGDQWLDPTALIKPWRILALEPRNSETPGEHVH